MSVMSLLDQHPSLQEDPVLRALAQAVGAVEALVAGLEARVVAIEKRLAEAEARLAEMPSGDTTEGVPADTGAKRKR